MGSSIIPSLRYHNAPKMMAWLCDAFGFTQHLVVEDGEGGIAHAQLILGDGMIMLGSLNDNEFGILHKTPQQAQVNTQSPYVVVKDVDKLCEQAKQAGADIVIQPRDEDYGGRGFGCRDPEGYVWYFGTFDPWTDTE